MGTKDEQGSQSMDQQGNRAADNGVIDNIDEKDQTLPTTTAGSDHEGTISETDGSEKKYETVNFVVDDPDNPHNWSFGRKSFITFCGIVMVTNSTFASSVPSGASTFIAKDFGITSSYLLTLLISFFLFGYVVGPVILAPISEYYGRRMVTLVAFAFFVIFSLASAASPNFPTLLAFRFLTGLGASAPLSITGGQFADIWQDPAARGRCVAIFCASTSLGPIIGPIMSGYVSQSPLGWRMTFWTAAIVAGVSYIPILFIPETFAPVILLKRAQRLRKETGRTDLRAPVEFEERDLKSMLKTYMTRPFRMFFTESIVFFSSLYLALIYSTFYLFFQSFPIIYTGIYGFTPGQVGLTFIPIALGCFLACGVIIYFDSHLAKRSITHPELPPPTDEYRRLYLLCYAGPLYFACVFWQAWSAGPNIHYMVPIASGLPFGLAFCIIFMGVLNYLTDAYLIFSASAMAAASMCRSIWGATLPLAAKDMYAALGSQWATSILGFAAVGMSVIPFLFLRYGEKIRAGSKFCQMLKNREREENERVAKMRLRNMEELEEELGMERVASLVEDGAERRRVGGMDAQV